ncbi:hypothetical protein [Streptomyces cellulosae]|uniref:Transposase IS4-like domain-containing protein n=1 Tax=Streptomyces cellulosae TaxID=1968 RepID=A0ABW7Y9M8_STRCE
MTLTGGTGTMRTGVACWANYAVDRHGTPLAVTLTGSNRRDSTQLLSLLEAVTPIRGLRGRPGASPDAWMSRQVCAQPLR